MQTGKLCCHVTALVLILPRKYGLTFLAISQEIGFNNFMLHELSKPIFWKNEAIYLLLNLNREP